MSSRKIRSPLHRVVRALILYGYRTYIGLRHLLRTALQVVRWLANSKETTNFTYSIEERNKLHLACFVAHIADVDLEAILSYFDELENDKSLEAHARSYLASRGSELPADARPLFARRLGWYALIRARKPNLVIETGVDKGLGALTITSALSRNFDEGFRGRYLGTEINPNAGYLLSGSYSDFGEVIYGDSIETLSKLEAEIDLFINDSDHSAEYERQEYLAVEKKLAPDAIILGDNSHATDELLKFASRTGRSFLFFKEVSDGHWYPGAGIGFAFSRRIQGSATRYRSLSQE